MSTAYVAPGTVHTKGEGTSPNSTTLTNMKPPQTTRTPNMTRFLTQVSIVYLPGSGTLTMFNSGLVQLFLFGPLGTTECGVLDLLDRVTGTGGQGIHLLVQVSQRVHEALDCQG